MPTVTSAQPGEAITIETQELIDRLEDLVEHRRQLFNKALIDVEEFCMLTNKLRHAIPEDIKAATRITEQASKIVDDAKAQGARIIDQSRGEASKIIEATNEQAAKLVEESEISKLATAQAKEIINSAEEEANSIKIGADEYAKSVLADLDNSVTKVMRAIQAGRDRLEQRAGSETKNE